MFVNFYFNFAESRTSAGQGNSLRGNLFIDEYSISDTAYSQFWNLKVMQDFQVRRAKGPSLPVSVITWNNTEKYTKCF